MVFPFDLVEVSFDVCCWCSLYGKIWRIDGDGLVEVSRMIRMVRWWSGAFEIWVGVRRSGI